MNTKYITLITLLLTLLTLVGCTRADQPQAEDAYDAAIRKMANPVTFTFAGGEEKSLRATEPTTGTQKKNALDREKKINDVWILVFAAVGRPGAGNTHHPGSLHLSRIVKANDIAFKDATDKSKGGTFDLIKAPHVCLEFIINPPAGLEEKLIDGLTWEGYKRIIMEADVPDHTSENFVMVNTSQVSIPNSGSTTPSTLEPIHIERLAARFDLFNKVEDFNLTEITLVKQVSKSYMLTQREAPETGTDKVFTVGSGDWITDTKAVAGIYSYENPTPGATMLKIKGTYKDKEWAHDIPLCDKVGNPLPIKRNHLYRITLAPFVEQPIEDPDKLPFQIKVDVVDWNEDRIADQIFEESERCTFYPVWVSGFGRIAEIKGYFYENSHISTWDDLPMAGSAYTTDFTLAVKDDKDGISIDGNKVTITPSKVDREFTLIATLNESGRQYEIPVHQKAMVNPLAYMAEYNVNQAGNGLDTYHWSDQTKKKDMLGLYSYYEAYQNFLDVTFDGKRYHLPSILEWQGIFGEALDIFLSSEGAAALRPKQYTAKGDMDFSKEDKSLTAEVDGVVLGTTRELFAKKNKTHTDFDKDQSTYAVRFSSLKYSSYLSAESEKLGLFNANVDTRDWNQPDFQYLSAWRYEFVVLTNTNGEKVSAVKISCVNLNPEKMDKAEASRLLEEEIAKPSFWENIRNREGMPVVVRYIPFAGWCPSVADRDNNGSKIWGFNYAGGTQMTSYWSSTRSRTNPNQYMQVKLHSGKGAKQDERTQAHTYIQSYDPKACFPVRLFSSEPIYPTGSTN